jgi:D-serine deaminase-like pyridoxal phosphate-dependent protein
MPFGYVDLDLFDANIEDMRARARGKPIRIASKSIRCVPLMRRILAHRGFKGIMAYSVREAAFLINHGFDDILVAYPAWGEVASSGVLEQMRDGKRLWLMADCIEHLRLLDALGRAAKTCVPVCLDIDMASLYPRIHFGVLRSPVRTPKHAVALYEASRKLRHVRIEALMGYEAQVAGLQDFGPYGFLKNQMVGMLKKSSMREVHARRTKIVKALRDAGCALAFVNGGGTGSIEATASEKVITEVAAGSGFYAPTLFDHYAAFCHLPAAGYAIEVVRRPAEGVYTCLGGGYAASGAAGTDKLPQPFLPETARLIEQEGAGEVQTPIRYAGTIPLKLGDPVFMRHAKAGELCERFNTLHLLEGGEVTGQAVTYRGEGQCFL